MHVTWRNELCLVPQPAERHLNHLQLCAGLAAEGCHAGGVSFRVCPPAARASCWGLALPVPLTQWLPWMSSFSLMDWTLPCAAASSTVAKYASCGAW